MYTEQEIRDVFAKVPASDPWESGAVGSLLDACDALRKQLADARKENARLQANLDCQGIHTCHDECMNNACRMRRERDQAVAEAAAVRGYLYELRSRYSSIPMDIDMRELDEVLKSSAGKQLIAEAQRLRGALLQVQCCVSEQCNCRELATAALDQLRKDQK